MSAVGTFATPSYPDIAGLDSFAGPCFHSARWEHDHDLVGRRVAVIGTGASAAQIVPELAKVAHGGRLPTHAAMDPARSDKPFTEEQKRRFARNPIAARRHRRELYWAFENTIAFRHEEGCRATQGDRAQPHRVPDQR